MCAAAAINDQARLRPDAASHPERVRARPGEAAQHTCSTCIPPLLNASQRCSPARGLQPQRASKPRDGRVTPSPASNEAVLLALPKAAATARGLLCKRRDGAVRGLSMRPLPSDRPGHAACDRHASRQGCDGGNSRERCLRSALGPHTPVMRFACSRGKPRAGLQQWECVQLGFVEQSLSSRLPCASSRRGIEAPPPGRARRQACAGRG
jgi:hypothetical protein